MATRRKKAKTVTAKALKLPDPERNAYVREKAATDEEAIRYTCMWNDPSVFAAEVLMGPEGPPFFGKFMIAKHHEDWAKMVMHNKKVMVKAPRGHGKSMFFSFALPIWMSWKYPGEKGFIFSATQTQAEERLEEVTREFENNPKLDDLFPKPLRKWGVKAIRTSNGHSIRARGMGVKVRGGHPLYLIGDDLLNDESAYSETKRTKETDYFYNAMSNMVKPHGFTWVIGTPFASTDLTFDLEKNQEYTSKTYAALNDNNEPLWPEFWSMERLMAKKREVGIIRFTREYLCRPISSDMSLFPDNLFVGDPVEQFQLKLGMPRAFWKKLGIDIYIAVDFAISSEQGADYTVIWVAGVDRYGNRWIIDVFRAHGMPYKQQKSKIVEYGRRYNPELMILESNQMQAIFGDELIEDTDLPIMKFTTGREKNTLDKGLPSMRILFENRKYRIPRGDAESVEMMELWKSEMQGFSFIDGKLKSLAKHDDTAMASWLCEQAIRHGSAAFYETEDEIEQEDLVNQNTAHNLGTTVDNLDLDQLVGLTKDQIEASGVDEDEDEDDGEAYDVFTGEPLGKESDNPGKKFPRFPW